MSERNDEQNLREVVESQSRLGHAMTLVPNDVLVRLLDRLATPAAGGLDAAWAEAEAALPFGWFISNLTNQAYRGKPERWMAQAHQGPEEDADYRLFKAASAPTPAAALLALAARLRQGPEK